jgi:hypothetical protein
LTTKPASSRRATPETNTCALCECVRVRGGMLTCTLIWGLNVHSRICSCKDCWTSRARSASNRSWGQPPPRHTEAATRHTTAQFHAQSPRSRLGHARKQMWGRTDTNGHFTHRPLPELANVVHGAVRLVGGGRVKAWAKQVGLPGATHSHCHLGAVKGLGSRLGKQGQVLPRRSRQHLRAAGIAGGGGAAHALCSAPAARGRGCTTPPQENSSVGLLSLR